ncbi:MlaC/ttg2D family ABC transporter substrate-binding protein [Oceaniglobus ichthyenteri]|uniref:MlaC/ttg2D family ABC transporter substrate-binding protein n=1 Tax=Oceaniglobus ichthyenteri TaxID=2136177 RepID=UPI001F0C255F|nr:ABC transporter substrate-binding protein [Oceaniglobus ichthyenteri]
MLHFMSRRHFIGGLIALPLAATAIPAFALNTETARRLVDALVGDINAVIASGKTGTPMFREFERIFLKFADVPTIARTTLGPVARTASGAQMQAFTKAFAGYVGRKYGSRFQEFIGGQIEVQSARPVKSFYEVKSKALLRGQSPVDLVFLISDRSGKDKFFDMLIEGVSLLKSERTEIGAMLDRRRGNIDQMTADLARAG